MSCHLSTAAPAILTPDALAARLGAPDAPEIVDVRLPEDLGSAPVRIPTAHLCPHDAIANWTPRRTEIALVCHKGRKLSHGAAALLRARGHHAFVVDGGMVAWRAADLPVIPQAALPENAYWVLTDDATPALACAAWLIRRFVQHQAVLMCVPAVECPDVAARFDATLCPVEDFATLLRFARETGLSLPALDQLLDAVAASPPLRCAITGAMAGQDAARARDRVAPILDALLLGIRQTPSNAGEDL